MKPTDRDIAFADWLRELSNKQKLGTLAALRRGLMYEEDQLFELYGHIPAHFMRGSTFREERVYLLVASLYAMHPLDFKVEELNLRRRNMGDSLRMYGLSKSEEGGTEGGADVLPESLKKRFEILVSSGGQDLPGHLRQMISLLKSGEIPVDWAQLLADLKRWEWKGNHVKWDWSRSFYAGNQEKEGENENENVS